VTTHFANSWAFGEAELHADQRRLDVQGQPVALSGRAFDLLVYLVRHRDRVIGKDELLQQVWPGVVVEESNLTVHVAGIRKALGKGVVATVSGRGYRFTAAVAQTAVPRTTADAATEPSIARDKPSLAVMPFANLSGDPAQDYFVDGVVDDLTSALSRVRRFFVIARSSAFTYKGRVVDVPQVGRELGVRYVLEGSFRMSGERLRIAVQLVETGAGRQVWAQRWEGSRSDIFDLQDEITAQVVAAIEPQLSLAEVERVRTKPTSDLRAYDLCMMALPTVMTSSPREDVERAIAVLDQAIAADPGYSYAKAMYAWAHSLGYASRWIALDRAAASLARAREAHREHRDDPTTLAYAGHALAYVGREHGPALHALDTALALNPSSMLALRSSGWVRTYVGDHELAIRQLERAMALSPLDPEIAYVLCALAFAHLGAGHNAEAVELATRAARADPGFVPGDSALLWSLGAAERWDEARAFLPHYLARRPGFRYGTWLREGPWTDESFRQRVATIFDELGVPR
jgi:TolB-like protein/tetratricopeptide (TPR) repeat protein